MIGSGAQKPYEFKGQLAASEPPVDRVANWLIAHEYIVSEATKQQQWEGVDLIAAKSSITLRIEVKSDFMAHRTGNVFIELLSNIESGRIGAVYSQSDFFCYVIVDTWQCFVLRTEKLRNAISQGVWGPLPFRTVNNGKYHTGGVFVKAEHLSEIAKSVIDLSQYSRAPIPQAVLAESRFLPDDVFAEVIEFDSREWETAKLEF